MLIRDSRILLNLLMYIYLSMSDVFFFKILHGFGARDLMVFGLGPMGCIPLQRVLSTSGGCQQKTNKLALSFNKATSNLVSQLSTKLPNASYRFGDAYDVVNDVITNPQKYGKTNQIITKTPTLSFSISISSTI